MSEPLTRMRPRVGSWNRATRSVTVVFPAPLRPTRATTDPPGTTTLKSRTTGRPSRYSNSTSSNRISCTTRGASRGVGPVRLVVLHRQHLEHALHRRQRPLQLGEGVDDVPHRVQQQERVPLERHDVADRRAADDVQVAAVPDDHHVDARHQQAPRRPQDQLAAVREQLLAQHGVPAAHVVEQLAHLPPERPDDADAGERLADPAVDLLRRPCGPSGRSAGCAARRRSSSASRRG